MLPAIAALLLLALLGGLAFVAMRMTATAKKDEIVEEEQVPRPAQAAMAAARAARPAGGRQAALDRMREGMRQRLAAQRAQGADAAAAVLDLEDSEGSGGESGSEDEGPAGRRGRRRAARRDAAAAEREAAEARASKRSAYQEARARRDAEREAQEAAQEEEMRRAAEERARREEEEARKWMSQIKVEEQGEEGDETGAAGESLLAALEAHVKGAKIVGLEALALEFGLRTADAIERIRALEAMGRLTGVMDERGKYIYISLEEMQSVAAFIRSRGRVAIGELAARSASLIDLEPRSDVAGAGAQGAKGAAGGLDFDQLLAAA